MGIFILQVKVKQNLNLQIVSSIFKGKQMVPIIDALEIDVSVVGNHDYVNF